MAVAPEGATKWRTPSSNGRSCSDLWGLCVKAELVLPRLRTHLDAADWAAAEAEFQADMASRDLAAHEDFAGLFSKLVACAPAPIGFGPRPFTD